MLYNKFQKNQLKNTFTFIHYIVLELYSIFKTFFYYLYLLYSSDSRNSNKKYY